jgi:2'-hydroxyisoflavone reductase
MLILGGTIFLGRHIVESALARGHEVTTFTRGQHNPDLFPTVERLRGDRKAGDLRALEGRTWDLAVDTCGYFPRVVRDSVRLLAPSIDHYTFVSTVSVYPDLTVSGIDETAPLGSINDPTVETVDEQTYGPLKVLCEKAAEEEMPGRVLIVRPGLIVGPYDPSDRFTYWVERVASGGRVLAPGRPERVVQVIDVRDIAEWIVRIAQDGVTGIYNATGPDRPLTFGEILDSAKAQSASDGDFTWVTPEFLAAHGVAPWSDMPVWVPEDGDSAGIFTIDCRRAVAAGLTFRPIDRTVAETLGWVRTLPMDRARRAGITRESEKALLADWDRSDATPSGARP